MKTPRTPIAVTLGLTTALATGVAVVSVPEPAHAFDLKKVGRQIKKDFGKAGKGLGNVRKKVVRDLNKNGAARKLVTGVGAGILVGIAADSPVAGIITGVAISAAPEVFKKDLLTAYRGDMDWSGSVNSRKKRIIVKPGAEISADRRREVNNRIKEDVKDVQRALKTLGLYDKGIDGDFGRGSRAAVVAYQKSLGLAETGSLTAAQRVRLFDDARQAGYQREAALNSTPAPIQKQASEVPVVQAVAVAPTFAEYPLAKSQFEAFGSSFLMSGQISAVTEADLLGDGSIVMTVADASSASVREIAGPVGGIYAEPHNLAPQWARVYYRAVPGDDPIVLNTRDDFNNADEAAVWIDDLNSKVVLLSKLTGSAPTTVETRIASAEPAEEAVPSSVSETPAIQVSTSDEGVQQPPLEVASELPAADDGLSVVPAADAQTDNVSIAGFEIEDVCRENVYVSFEFPSGHDPISHYNIEPPEGTIMMDNGDGTAYFMGPCVKGDYAFSYVHIDKGQSSKDWKHNKLAGNFEIASNNEQCSVSLNTPEGSAEVLCY